jgi:hypothetical protein
MKNIFGILFLISFLFVSCDPKTNSDSLLVENQPISTVLTLANGTQQIITENGIGKKEVALKLTARKDLSIKNILLTYWDAGQNRLSKSIEFNTIQNLSPTADSIFIFKQFLPDSEKKELCQGMYFMWTLSYQIANDTTMGMYIGQPQLVMPTEKRNPNGSIEQALCAEPPAASI